MAGKAVVRCIGVVALLAVSTIMSSNVQAQQSNPKREFRGAWLHTVFQSQYSRQSTEENQKYLSAQLDSLQRAGINVVLWQVRPQADALYISDLEPWSRHLTGKAGEAPSPLWDPLQYMIDECHSRGMELHAWLNPYRVTCTSKETLPKGHIYYEHPEWFVRYDGKLYFNPGLDESREFICKVVGDIVQRYDVDAIHMDDYFYPYPVKGLAFNDNATYKKYGEGMSLGDWRRKNVDMLIEDVYHTIREQKPWVRFGVSPFGVWRNKKNDPRGSDTNAFENYSGLYADVLKWSEEGWVDYLLPQLYWELEHKLASSQKLAYWWDEHANGRHMYFGQDVRKTMDKHSIDGSGENSQLDHKIRLSRELEHVQGNCWWPGYDITSNYKGVLDSLAMKRESTVSLVPSYPWIDATPPDEVEELKCVDLFGHKTLMWYSPHTDDPLQVQKAFVVYCFKKGEKIDLERADAIVSVTYDPQYTLPDSLRGSGKVKIVVTALDRCNNESKKGVSLDVKL